MKHFYANKNVLVTGGAGFIGSHLVDKLVSLGANVTVLDNFITGDIDNLQQSMHAVTVIDGDIRDYATCLTACNKQDIIFHLAAMVSVPEATENPLACHATNVTGTMHLLEAAYQQKVQTCIFSSSSAVYGYKNNANQETDICNPSSIYGTSKLIGEEYMRLYAQKGLQTVCLRYFNVFGDRQQYDSPYAGAVARFKAALQAQQPITIFGNGLQTRDFIPVEHVVQYNLASPLLAAQHLNGQAINIASGTSITLLDLIKQLETELKTEAIVQFKPARTGDIINSYADCTKKDELFYSMRTRS